jgi:hypothetical protein
MRSAAEVAKAVIERLHTPPPTLPAAAMIPPTPISPPPPIVPKDPDEAEKLP